MTEAEIRKRLYTEIPSETPYRISAEIRDANITAFNRLTREGLEYGHLEQRILLYQTQFGEKIYAQYPGSESQRLGARIYPFDFRPILIKPDGTAIPDMDFRKIWDIIDQIGGDYQRVLDILAALFLRMAFMVDYLPVNKSHRLETVDIESQQVVACGSTKFFWNRFYLADDLMAELNDRIGILGDISLEGFLYYNDVLAQNEDCKYRYIQKEHWLPKNGRVNTCLTHLSVISHLRHEISLSKLIDRFQRGRGVAPLPQNCIEQTCGGIVRRI